ncbi:MAG: hypothetical protein L3J66_09895 [Bacteroidales bacterium]|nr:hypothetical protein [Bacteroidales bacterium]
MTSNRIGNEREISFSGGSIAVGPEGGIIAEASCEKEEILFITFDPAPAPNKMLTEKNRVLNDRIPDNYKEITGN